MTSPPQEYDTMHSTDQIQPAPRGILRQVIRGCGDLPYVGSHPGTGGLLLFIGLAFCAAAHRDGWRSGLLFGGCIAAFFVPLYLVGAYGRAQDSDRYAHMDDEGATP